MKEQRWQTVSVGPKTMQNPLVFGPHRLNFPEGHLPGPQRIAYYVERAKYGVGMIIIEGSQVLPGEYPYDWALNVYETGAREAYGKLAAAIQSYDCLCVGQLNLYGMQGDSSVTRKPLLAPSPVPEVNSNEIPKVMDTDDIAQVIAGFTLGAQLLAEADLDGVEINAGQFSLLRQFLSGLTNFRSDAYGGSLAKKCRLLLEVLQGVRKVLGKERILGLRLCGDEYAPWGGIQPEEAKEIAAYLTSQVALDYLAVETGSIYSVNMTMAGYQQPEDYQLAAAKTVGQGLTLPVFAGGSLVSTKAMTEALADFAGIDVTRALIADPALPEKWMAGRGGEIVPCILCKQGCHTHANTNPVIACSMNPQAGVEYRQGAKEKREKAGIDKPKKHLAVAGGGPAGLMAALHLLQQGHQVDLYETKATLGGHWHLFAAHFAAAGPQKVIPYFENQLQTYLENHQLQLHLATKLELAAAKTYDGVIVATGAEYQQSGIPGNAVTLSLAELLQKPLFPGKRALVVDDLGDEKAVVACRHLCQHGYQVVLVTTAAYQAAKLVKLGEFSAWYGEMAALGILEKANARVVSADVEQLVLADVYTGQQEALAGVDVVIEIAAPKVQDDLWQALQRQGVPCVCVGDAVAPRGLAAALREGYAAAIGW